jgi:uncharacterized protein
VVLNVTHACNLACGYCFARKAGDQRPRTEDQSGAMPLSVARKALHLLDPGAPVDVAFFGGEPLLAWDLIREILEEARRFSSLVGRPSSTVGRPKFHITTNALLLDEGKIRFLSGQNCSLLVSLDGPEDIHNAARPARNQAVNSFRGVMAALERTAGTPLNRRIMARATFDAAQPQLLRRLQFLSELDDAGLIHGYSIEPAVLGEGCAERKSAPSDLSDLSEEYHAAAQWFVDRVRAGRSANFFHFRKLVERILYVKHAGTECGAGNGYITVAPDGSIHACHRQGTPIGHVDYGIDEEARSAWADNRLYRHQGCMKCWARYLCGGGCRQACLELASSLHGETPERCFIQRTMLKECLWILTQVPEEMRKLVHE